MNDSSEQCYLFGPFVMYPSRLILTKDGQRISLRPRVFEVLKLFLDSNGAVMMRIPVIVGSDSGTIVGSDSGSSWAVRLA